MALNARSVLSALKRMDAFNEIDTIANDHGPLFHQNVKELIGLYRKLTQNKPRVGTNVGIFYISEYGYSTNLIQAIAKDITKTEAIVKMVHLRGVC